MVWDGSNFPQDPERIIGDVLEGGLEGYYSLYHFDLLGSYEDQLLSRHGLSCEIFLLDAGVIKARLRQEPQALIWEPWDPDNLQTCSVEQFLFVNREYVASLRRLIHVIDA
jgi:hypothetical protein